MLLLARSLALCLLARGVEFGPYPDGSTMTVALAGEKGDAARVTVVPAGANRTFLRYQGFINGSALVPSASFTCEANTSTFTILARPGWRLNVSLLQPLVSLSIGGAVVAADLAPPISLAGAACDPPGWKGLAPGIGMTVASSGSCLRGVRTLSGGEDAAGPTDIRDEHIYGFGQTVTPGLSAVGATKFIATFSRTLDTGPSHAPSPSYMSLARRRRSNASVAHGFFLNTHGFSAFDVGHNDSRRLLVSSPDPLYDYFLFAGPTPAAVIGQFSEVVGGRLSLPPRWAMGMKYDPAEQGSNQTFITTVIRQFAERGVRPERVVLEPVWQGAQYNFDASKFADVPALVAALAPTKLILWEHPILVPEGSPGTASDGFYRSLADADCLAAAAPAAPPPLPGSAMPAAAQFSDLTLPRCQELWKGYQLRHAIRSGAVGFKLDEDDVDVAIGFNDSVVFPSGFRGHQYHNIQGYIWQRLFHEMYRSLGRRTWLQSRGGYAGSQAYPTNSYSDGYTYSTYVLGVVNSGFSGLIWAPEMRHATCGPQHSAKDHADFARRTQLMFLSPQAQYNAWDSKDGTTLWPTGGPGAAACGPEWMAMFKAHYDLRTSLAAYLYSAFEAQSRTGVPLARALVIDSPEDGATWAIDDQFLLGDGLMFPPAGMSDPQSTSRRVYFPRTAPSWHSWWPNASDASNATVHYAHYAPGRWATVPTPIMAAPLFVKGGKPIFVQRAAATAHDGAPLGVSVWVPPTPQACRGDAENGDLTWSAIYDDDGETTDYQAGEHWRGAAGFASCADGRLHLRFRQTHVGYATAWRRVVWTLRGVHAPVSVQCSAGVDADWSLSADRRELRLSADLGGHACVLMPM